MPLIRCPGGIPGSAGSVNLSTSVNVKASNQVDLSARNGFCLCYSAVSKCKPVLRGTGKILEKSILFFLVATQDLLLGKLQVRTVAEVAAISIALLRQVCLLSWLELL